MSDLIMLIIGLACAVPVLVRALCIVARVPREGWPVWRHLGFTAAGPCLAVGSIGVVLGADWGGLLLLAGLALSIALDRRQRRDRRAPCN
ncbi:hypothetical protein [Methyloversatilis sp.]|uniref:hypothetical protein n=1 Tax=Methyloversatilis sp. TaxID=2569862 RepID=UPI0035B28C5E